jgi:hypothetical protein
MPVIPAYNEIHCTGCIKSTCYIHHILYVNSLFVFSDVFKLLNMQSTQFIFNHTIACFSPYVASSHFAFPQVCLISLIILNMYRNDIRVSNLKEIIPSQMILDKAAHTEFQQISQAATYNEFCGNLKIRALKTCGVVLC